MMEEETEEECGYDVVLQGWMEKKGHIRRSWKRRWFVLSQDRITYYSDNSKIDMKGEIILDKSTKIRLRDGRTHFHKFIVETGGRELTINAANEEDREDWVNVITNVANGKLRKNSACKADRDSANMYFNADDLPDVASLR